MSATVAELTHSTVLSRQSWVKHMRPSEYVFPCSSVAIRPRDDSTMFSSSRRPSV